MFSVDVSYRLQQGGSAMNLHLRFTLAFLAILTSSSYSYAENCDYGSPISGEFHPQKDEIPFYKGPGANYGTVINAKASEIFGEPMPRTLWLSNTLKASCITDGWVKGKIIASDGRPVNWETGWASLEYVKGEMTSDQKAGLFWDGSATDASEAEKAQLRAAALNVLKSNPNCASIISGDRSTSRDGQFFVTCAAKSGEAFNVFFSLDQASSKSIKAPTAVSSSFARQACETLIMNNATHPSTVDIHGILGFATTAHNNGNRAVILDFSAKNSFGLELEYTARCLTMPNGDTEITIVEKQG
jgi:hypothetical protein